MMGWYELDLSSLRKGLAEGSYQHGNQPSGSKNFDKFLSS
jgi:hypothetical protein